MRQEVKTKDGFIKTVVADNEQELAEGVAAVKSDSYPVSLDLHNPKIPNQIVSPDNKHTENPPVQPPQGSTEPTAEAQGAENEIRKANERAKSTSNHSTENPKEVSAKSKKTASKTTKNK